MTSETRIVEQWDAVLEHLRARVPTVSFDTWFAHTTLEELADGTAVVGVASLFIKEWLRDRYLDAIEDAFAATCGCRPDITFRIAPEPFRALRAGQDEDTPSAAIAPPSRKAAPARDGGCPDADRPTAPERAAPPVRRLHDFIAGTANRMALAACERVADLRPDFNLLFLHGESGLGKTHLLLGLQHELRSRDDELRVHYTTCGQFLTDFLRAVEDNKREAFRRGFGRNEVLLIDDVQTLACGKRQRTQEEFLLIFDDLLRRGRHVVLAADAAPGDIPGLLPRLARRLGAGLTLRVQAPDHETRISIAAAKAGARGLSLPQETLASIARRSHGCVREIEGTIARIAAYVEIVGGEPDPAAVRDLLGPSPADALDAPPPSLDELIDAVTETFHVEKRDIRGRKRTAPVRTARTAAMVLARELTGASYQEIGSALGGRKHATVISAIKNAKGLFDGDSLAAERFRRLQARFPTPRQSRLFDQHGDARAG